MLRLRNTPWLWDQALVAITVDRVQILTDRTFLTALERLCHAHGRFPELLSNSLIATRCKRFSNVPTAS
jgi:hypothetical protein